MAFVAVLNCRKNLTEDPTGFFFRESSSFIDMGCKNEDNECILESCNFIQIKTLNKKINENTS